MITQITAIMPEIMLALLAMSAQIAAVFFKNQRKIALYTILLAIIIIYYVLTCKLEYEVLFNGTMIASSNYTFLKALILAISLLSVVLYRDMVKVATLKFRAEFMTLVLFAALGAFIAISARDFMLLFCGLELQALAGYALTAFNTEDGKSSEAGLKYFILGALMSTIMLLGISFLYGFSGSIKFIEVREMLASDINIGLVIGVVLVLANILFKLSAVPLHIWTPDVYQGAPISAVSYFATAQKLAILIVLINFMDGVVGQYAAIEQLLKVIAILSMCVGALGGLRQHNLKRLLAYSTILNIGYVLMGISLHTPAGNYAAFLFLLIYALTNIGIFACLIGLLGKNSEIATFDHLAGVAPRRKTLALVIALLVFSLMGLPPMAGFFGKYYIFYQAIMEGEITLALVGVVTSVIAAFYYLKIIKYMYFVQNQEKIVQVPTRNGLRIVTALSLGFVLFFCVFAKMYIA